MMESQSVNYNKVTQELDHRLLELNSLFEMSKVLNSSLDLETILNNLLLTPMGRMMISRGLALLSAAENEYVIKALKGTSRNLIDQKVFLESIDRPVTIVDANKVGDRINIFLKEHGLELLLPIRSSNKTVGLMGFSKKINNQTFKDTEIEFLSSLCNIAATSIENALMFKTLKSVNRRLDKKIQELNTLFDISKELNSTLNESRVVNLLIYAIMGEMVVNRCVVFLKTNDEFKIIAQRGISSQMADSESLQNKDFVNILASITEPVLVDNHGLLKDLEILKKQNFRLIIPMRAQDETKGIIVIGDKLNHFKFGADEVEFLSTLGNQAIISIENARLFREALEKQRYEEELAIARNIQQKLLPSSELKIGKLDIQGINIPSREVGGDYYDRIKLDENRIAIVIADVSGKGVGASLLMANLQASLHSLVFHHENIADMVADINNLIHARTDFDKFITFFYGEINIHTMELTYINAGHNPPYLCHESGELEKLEKGGLLLGMMPDVSYESETKQLSKGDSLILFTDGVTEAKNIKDEEFEEWRLETFLKKHSKMDIKNIINKIISIIRDFSDVIPQTDDLTILGVKVLE